MGEILTVFGLVVAIIFGTIQSWPIIQSWRTRKEKEVSAIDVPKNAASTLEKKKIVIGLYPYPPFLIGSKPEEMEGIWKDLGVRISEALGKEAEFQWFTMGDLSSESVKSVDLAMGIFKTERRSRKFNFSKPFHRIGLQGLCAKNHDIISEEDLRSNDIQIVVQEGEVGWEYALDDLPGAHSSRRVIVVNTAQSINTIGMISSKEADVALIDEITCQNFLKKPNMKRYYKIAFHRPIKIFDACVAVNPNSDLDLDLVNKCISEFRNSPEFLKKESEALKGYEKIVSRAGLHSFDYPTTVTKLSITRFSPASSKLIVSLLPS